MLVERAFGQIVARKLGEHQREHGLSDVATARLARVTQPHWSRVRRGLEAPDSTDAPSVGEQLISGLAVVLPDLLRDAIDEVQELKGAEVERLRGLSATGSTGDVGAADSRAAQRVVGAAT